MTKQYFSSYVLSLNGIYNVQCKQWTTIQMEKNKVIYDLLTAKSNISVCHSLCL